MNQTNRTRNHRPEPTINSGYPTTRGLATPSANSSTANRSSESSVPHTNRAGNDHRGLFMPC